MGDDRAREPGMLREVAHHEMPTTARDARRIDIAGGEPRRQGVVQLP